MDINIQMEDIYDQKVIMVGLTLADISKQLTEGVIQNVFSHISKTKDCVREIKVTRGAPPGEGLLSAVYKVYATGKQQTVSIFVKGLVKDELLRKSLNCVKYFNRELFFYSEILPTLIKLEKSTGAIERFQNDVPICYGYFTNGTDDYLLIENVSESKCNALSLYPTEFERHMTLKVLAHLHAVSIALRTIRPDDFLKIADSLPEVYYLTSNKDWYVRFLEGAININKDVIEEYEDPSTIYYQKFMDLANRDVYDDLINLVTTRGDNPVLTHGDAWCTNFLCSKERAVAIDFQFFRCSSSVIDFGYFLMLCSSHFDGKKDYIKAVKVYYGFLTYYLKDMGLEANDVYSWDTLKEELKKYGKFGILAALTSIPLIISERYDSLEYDNTNKSKGIERISLQDLWKLTAYKTTEEKMRLVTALHIAVDMGFI